MASLRAALFAVPPVNTQNTQYTGKNFVSAPIFFVISPKQLENRVDCGTINQKDTE